MEAAHTRTYPKLHKGQNPLCSVHFYTTSPSFMLKPQQVLENNCKLNWQVAGAVQLQSSLTLKHSAFSAYSICILDPSKILSVT